MPRYLAEFEHMDNGATVNVWDYEEEDPSDLRELWDVMREKGGRFNVNVVVSDQLGREYWYGGTVFHAYERTQRDLQLEIEGLMEQGPSWIGDDYLASVSASFSFSGIGVAIQSW